MKTMRSIGGIATLFLLLCVSLVHPQASAANVGFGLPFGAKPVDVDVIDLNGDGVLEIVVLAEVRSDVSSEGLDEAFEESADESKEAYQLAGRTVPPDASSVLIFQVEQDGGMWLEKEAVLAVETAIKIEEETGFRVTRADLISTDPSQLVVTGYQSGTFDRLMILSHGFEGIFDIPAAISPFQDVLAAKAATGTADRDKDAFVLLNWLAFERSRDLSDLYFVEGDPFFCFLDVNQDGLNDVAIVTPADKYIRIYKGLGNGEFDQDALLFEGVVGDKGDEPGFVGAANLHPSTAFPVLSLIITRKGILSNQIELVQARGGVGILPYPGGPIDTTEQPRSVIAGDFTGDAIPDLVVAGMTAFVLLPGTGLDSYGMPQFAGKIPGGDITVPSDFVHPIGLVAEDFNFDGKLDLAVANYGSSEAAGGWVDIWMGSGGGAFSLRDRMRMGSGANPIELVSADFNHDGWIDLAVVNQGTNDLRILLNDGDAPSYTLPSAQYPGCHLAVTNLNLTGGDEIIQSYYIEPFFAGIVSPGFIEPTDAAGLNVVAKLLFQHARIIEDVSYGPATSPEIVTSSLDAFADKAAPTDDDELEAFNRTNIAVASTTTANKTTKQGTVIDASFGIQSNGLPEAEINTGNVLTDVGGVYAGAIQTGDLDGDGYPEIVVFDPNSSTVHALRLFEIRKGTKTQDFWTLLNGPATADDTDVLVSVDVMYDLVSNELYEVESPLATPTAVVLGDFYEESAGQEIALLCSKTNEAIILAVEFDEEAGRNLSKSLSAEAIGWGPTGSMPIAGLAADVDRDGDTDLLVVNYNDDTVAVLMNNGNWGSADALGFDFDEDWVYQESGNLDGPIAIASADFNNDGEEEFVVAGYLSNSLVILAPNAIGALRRVGDIETDQGPYSLVAADLNDDGFDDIAIVSGAGLEIFPGTGTFSFGESIIVSAADLGGLPLSVAAGDFNDDGNMQIAVSLGIELGYPAEKPSSDLWIRTGAELF